MSVFTSHLSTTTHTVVLLNLPLLETALDALASLVMLPICIQRFRMALNVQPMSVSAAFVCHGSALTLCPMVACKDVPRSHVWLLGQNILVGPELQVPSWYLSRVFQSRRNREPMGLVCSLGQLRSGSEVFPSLAPPKLPLFGPTGGVLDLGTFGPVVFQASPPGSVRSGGAQLQFLVACVVLVVWLVLVFVLAPPWSMSPLEGSLGAPEVTTTGHTPPTPLVSLPSSPRSARSDSMSPVTSPGVDHLKQPQDPRSPSVHQQQQQQNPGIPPLHIMWTSSLVYRIKIVWVGPWCPDAATWYAVSPVLGR
ncbi:hypothetical protein BDB00DRAFT_943695 [Zychaea mexicana]|uniref:uncharacterized protein n=1 Tax=Zychaea mexicana TaxID=64656 RepID=UPI0022FF1349|nr:uncharacterized protein BDB00DRAFT_943695 [Zychaea mexicana]KAI9471397.1 hypothetical protein BDB00DRAFT_943695 [Zychaea mexicana]